MTEISSPTFEDDVTYFRDTHMGKLFLIVIIFMIITALVAYAGYYYYSVDPQTMLTMMKVFTFIAISILVYANFWRDFL